MNTMIGCNQSRKLIDEADNPESLAFEASSHIAACAGCEAFAVERARLRSLLVSGPRVTVPVNFDAVLKSRLAQTQSRGSFAWLSPAGYLRLGGATAALAVMVFAAQYSGLFGRAPAGQQGMPVAIQEQPRAIEPSQQESQVNPGLGASAVGASTPVLSRPVRRNLYAASAATTGVPIDVPGEDYLHEDGGVVLVRRPNGEGEVSLPMVSVGAQSMVYASAGASRRPVRTIGTSF